MVFTYLSLTSAVKVSLFTGIDCAGPSGTLDVNNCTTVPTSLQNSRSINALPANPPFILYSDDSCLNIISTYPGGTCYNLPEKVGSIYKMT